ESIAAYLLPNGGTFKIDVGSNTPVVAQVKDFKFHIANNLSGIPLAKSVLPDDVFPGEQIFDGSCTLIANDFTDWRKLATGTGAGTAVQETPVYGSLDMKVLLDATHSLQIQAFRAGFLMDFPDADPKGGPTEFPLAFSIVRPLDGSAAVTAVVKND